MGEGNDHQARDYAESTAVVTAPAAVTTDHLGITTTSA
jgi:hypothetical protein